MTKSKEKNVIRKVLVIFSNRLNRLEKPRFLEIECNDRGEVLSEHKLHSEPKKPIYDEIWENDDGKTDFAACHNFKRKFGHKLQKNK